MLTTENLEIYSLHKDKANAEFKSLMWQADTMLQSEKNNCLKFPVEIDDDFAFWHYKSLLTHDDPDCDEFVYDFENLTIGVYVTTKLVLGKGHQDPCLTIFIGNRDAEVRINFICFDLADELDLVKITDHIATVAATFRDFETFISNMDYDRRLTATCLLTNLYHSQGSSASGGLLYPAFS